MLEADIFQGRLRKIANTKDWSDELSTLSSNLYAFALDCEKSVVSARRDADYKVALVFLVRALASSMLCDRYTLLSYATLARVCLGYLQNCNDAALWCDRYRRAESDLLAEEESNLGIYARAIRECLDPENARQTAEGMRRVLPKHLLDEYVPGFDSSDSLTPREVVEQIEDLILEEMCHGHV
jgi:hypothetical protein